jgi:hypothetical protein
VASHSAFANGQAINRNNMRVNESALRGTHVTNGVNATPTHASYLGATNMHGRVATPSNNIQNRAVVARTVPAASASHLPVHTMNTSTLRPGHYNAPTTTSNVRGASVGGVNNRPGGFGGNASVSNNRTPSYADRPPSYRPQGGMNGNSTNNSVNRPSAARPESTPTRTWHAQGNATDSGRGPQGFGGSNRPTAPVRTTQMNPANRPPSMPGNVSGGYNGNVNRPPSSNNNNRTYRPPTVNNNGNRGYSAPQQNHSYSPPPSYNGSRGTSAPHSSSSPPSPRSYGGGGGSGGSSHPSGGGGSHPSGGGGGGSHSSSGGGGGSHPSGGGSGGSHPHR